MKTEEQITLTQELADALQAAYAHLDYCGWGDSYEREGSEPIQQQVQAALKRAKKANLLK